MEGHRFLLSLVALATLIPRYDGFLMNVNPDVIRVGQTPSLTVRCEDPGVPVNGINIKEVSAVTKLLASVAIFYPNGTLMPDSGLQGRANVSGQLSATTPYATYLSLSIFNLKCTDAGVYQCEVQVSTGSTYDNRTVNATVVAGAVTMTVTPPAEIKYAVNESARITCFSDVGRPATGSWVLERYDESITNWTPVTISPPNSVDPVITNPIDSCSVRSSITWTVYLQADDNNRMYRCYYGTPMYNSANYTFYLNIVSTPSPQPQEVPTSANAGMIVGIVLGILALIAIIVVLVFFFVIRKKKNKGEEYSTGESERTRTPEPAPVKPVDKKHGVENKGMDVYTESTNKGRSKRNDQDKARDRDHDRDHHPPAYDEHDGGRRTRDRDHDRDRDYDRDGHRYDGGYYNEDGKDNQGYVPQDAIGSSV